MAPPLEGPVGGHTDAVTSVVITDRGLVMSGGLDRALCLAVLSKPRDTVRRVDHAHAKGAISVAHDAVNNWFISGGFDGAIKVWSADAKPVMHFDSVADDAVRLAYVPLTHCYWHVDRFGHVQAYDARALAPVTDFVADASSMEGHNLTGLWTPTHCDSVFGATKDGGVLQWRYDAF